MIKHQSLYCKPTTAICRSGFYQLRQIRPAIRSFTLDAAKTIVQAFIACCLDWCNSLLCGVPENLLRKFSLCRTLPIVYSPTQGTVTTAHRCCVNYIGCQFTDEWSSRLPALCTSHWHQQLQRTLLPTFDLSPNMVVVLSARHPTEHSLTRSSFGDRSFAAAGQRLWSSLATNLRQMTSYGQFRRHLK